MGSLDGKRDETAGTSPSQKLIQLHMTRNSCSVAAEISFPPTISKLNLPRAGSAQSRLPGIYKHGNSAILTFLAANPALSKHT